MTSIATFIVSLQQNRAKRNARECCWCQWRIARAFLCAFGAAFAADVTVHYHNEAGLSEKTLGQAIETANRALRQAGVQVKWVDCYRNEEKCRNSYALEVTITERSPAKLRSASYSMGYSLLPGQGEQGVYAKVMWNRVRRYAEAFDIPAVKVLGNAIAHEIGHLLLDSGEHSREGIMKANWSGSEKAALLAGRFQFQGYEAARMRQRAARMASSVKQDRTN